MDDQNRGFLITTFRVAIPTRTRPIVRNMNPCDTCKKSHLGCIVTPPYDENLCKRCGDKGLRACPGRREICKQKQEKVTGGGTDHDGEAQFVSTAAPSLAAMRTVTIPETIGPTHNHPTPTVLPIPTTPASTILGTSYQAPRMNVHVGVSLVSRSTSAGISPPNQTVTTLPLELNNGHQGWQAGVAGFGSK